MVDSEIRLKGSAVQRRRPRNLGIFLDGPALDRASKRLGRKIDLRALVQAVSSGLSPVALRYYTLIPNEDDSRHRAFLTAVSSAGFEAVVKRLPPKGVNKQISIDVEMTADMITFGRGVCDLPRVDARSGSPKTSTISNTPAEDADPTMVLICPSKELTYPLTMLKAMKVDVTVADFMKPGNSDLVKACKSWIDLSDSETIWR